MNKLACLCCEKDWFCCTRNILSTYCISVILSAKHTVSSVSNYWVVVTCSGLNLQLPIVKWNKRLKTFWKLVVELTVIKLQNILLSLNILSPKLIKSISFYGSYVFAFKENSAQVTSNTSCLILIYGLIKERSRPNRISCKSSLAYVFDFLHTSFGLTQTHEMSTL